MPTYTATDKRAAVKFAEANVKIKLIRKLYDKAPHLASWLNYEIRKATQSDFYIPTLLLDKSYVVDIKISENLCDALSCNPIKEKEVCTPADLASYYYVGDDSYDVQCQPACFNTVEHTTYNEKGNAVPQTIMLHYGNNKCNKLNSPIISILEKTYYRSDTHYQLRLNDMPTGFSRSENNDPTTCGLDYSLNPAYCSYFSKTWDEKSKTCDLEGWQKFVDMIFGIKVFFNIISGVRMLTNNNIPFSLPAKLPKLPEKMNPIYTLDGWKKNINPEFKLPSPIDMFDTVDISEKDLERRLEHHTTVTKTTTTNSNGGGGDGSDQQHRRVSRDLEHENEEEDNEENTTTTFDFLANDSNLFKRQSERYEKELKHLLMQKRQNRHLNKNNEIRPYFKWSVGSKRKITDVYESIDPALNERDRKRKKRSLDSDETEETISSSAKEDLIKKSAEFTDAVIGNENIIMEDNKDDHENIIKFRDQLNEIYRQYFTLVSGKNLVETARYVDLRASDIDPRLVVPVAGDILLQQLAKRIPQIAEKISAKVGESILLIEGKIGETVVQSAISSAATRIVVQEASRLAAKEILLLGKILGAAVSVLGWILIVGFVLDIIFTFWDPFGYKNELPPNYPAACVRQSELSYRSLGGISNMDYTFEDLCTLLLSQEERITIEIESLFDQLIYLDALVVNSEGSLIDKGEPLVIVPRAEHLDDFIRQKRNANRFHFDHDEFEEYNKKFLLRATINKYLNFIATIFVCSSVVCFFLSLYILFITLAILALIIFSINRIEIYDKSLIEFITTYG